MITIHKDKLYNKLAKDEGLAKWLRYGFTFLTGIVETSISAILAYLRSVKKMSDEDILRLATQTYPVRYSSYMT